jgi:hypothetical protein
MLTKEDRTALYNCKQSNGKYRKEIENSGVFLAGIDEMNPYIAQQPEGQWQSFDHMPIISVNGWNRVGDRPDNLSVEGNLNIPWEQTLCSNPRYGSKIVRIRKTIRVRGF